MAASEPDERNARYAIYWAPAGDTALTRIGAPWLGRDATTDRALARPRLAGFDDAMLTALTADPRRYGLHATLKPPFRLAAAASVTALEAELADFAAATEPVTLSSIHVTRIGNFLALVPTGPAPSVTALANACVKHFDRYRAPASDDELVRRNAAGLTAAQRTNLNRWGYPYVMDEFRFHVTLTGSLDQSVADRLLPALSQLFADAIAETVVIHDIALFVQHGPGGTFRLVRRFTLADH